MSAIRPGSASVGSCDTARSFSASGARHASQTAARSACFEALPVFLVLKPRFSSLFEPRARCAAAPPARPLALVDFV